MQIMGREISTPWILGGSAVGIGAVFWYRHNKKNQATTQTQNQQAGIDPNTGQPYASEGIDPTTGQPYSQEYGNYTYQPEGAGYGPYGLDSYGSGGSGAYGSLGYYGGGVPYPVQQQATTNAQWSEAAVSALTAQGYNGMQVLAALGLYLTGGQLSADQASIVQAAIAAEGYPPNPPSGGIITSPPGGPPPPPGTNQIAVPNVIGKTELQASQIIAKAGLHPHGPPVSKNGAKKVKSQNPSAGVLVAKGSTVSVTV